MNIFSFFNVNSNIQIKQYVYYLIKYSFSSFSVNSHFEIAQWVYI
jgi:hypothetical protein